MLTSAKSDSDKEHSFNQFTPLWKHYRVVTVESSDHPLKWDDNPMADDINYKVVMQLAPSQHIAEMIQRHGCPACGLKTGDWVQDHKRDCMVHHACQVSIPTEFLFRWDGNPASFELIKEWTMPPNLYRPHNTPHDTLQLLEDLKIARERAQASESAYYKQREMCDILRSKVNEYEGVLLKVAQFRNLVNDPDSASEEAIETALIDMLEASTTVIVEGETNGLLETEDLGIDEEYYKAYTEPESDKPGKPEPKKHGLTLSGLNEVMKKVYAEQINQQVYGVVNFLDHEMVAAEAHMKAHMKAHEEYMKSQPLKDTTET